MNKVVRLTENRINKIVQENVTRCVRESVARQLEKECVETLLECTTIAVLESFFGEYVDNINNNHTYTLNEAKLSEAEQDKILAEVYSIYKKSFVRECGRQFGEMMTEKEVNEILPLIAGAAGAVGKRLLGNVAKKAVGGIANKLGKTAVGKAVQNFGNTAIGNGIKNVVGGLGRNLLGGGAAQTAANAGTSGGANLMNLLKNGGGGLSNLLSGNPGMLSSLLGNGGNGAGGNMGNLNNFIPMLMNMLTGGNGGGMAGNLANMFGGGNKGAQSNGGNQSNKGGSNNNAGAAQANNVAQNATTNAGAAPQENKKNPTK